MCALMCQPGVIVASTSTCTFPPRATLAGSASIPSATIRFGCGRPRGRTDAHERGGHALRTQTKHSSLPGDRPHARSAPIRPSVIGGLTRRQPRLYARLCGREQSLERSCHGLQINCDTYNRAATMKVSALRVDANCARVLGLALVLFSVMPCATSGRRLAAAARDTRGTNVAFGYGRSRARCELLQQSSLPAVHAAGYHPARRTSSRPRRSACALRRAAGRRSRPVTKSST